MTGRKEEENNATSVRQAKKSSFGLGGAVSVALVICFVIALIPNLTGNVDAATLPTDASMRAQVVQYYKDALVLYNNLYHHNYTNFTSKCGAYSSTQLMLLGVNTDYVGADGKNQFDYYKNKTVSSGGMKIHAYPAAKYSIADALKDIYSHSRIATNILFGFEATATATGKIYGHVMVVHAIIDGKCYFSDNFTIRNKYKQGECVVFNIDEMQSYYGQSIFKLDGIIWFEDESLTKAVNQGGVWSGVKNAVTIGAYTPVTTKNVTTTKAPEKVYSTGTYRVKSGSDLDMLVSASAKAEVKTTIPEDTVMYVTQVSSKWGLTFYADTASTYEGWIDLSAAERIGALPTVLADSYATNGSWTGRSGYSSLSAAIADSDESDIMVYRLQTKLTEKSEVYVGYNRTVELGSNTLSFSGNGKITLRGGTVTSSKTITQLESDPLVDRTKSGTLYTYKMRVSVSITSASLAIGDNVALRFRANYSETNLPSGAVTTYTLCCTDAEGDERTYAARSCALGNAIFVTDGIPAKYMGDEVTAYVRCTVKYKNQSYVLNSMKLTYSPVLYAKSAMGYSDSLDNLLAAIMNYASESQEYFGYNTDSLANRYLPDEYIEKFSTVGDLSKSEALPCPAVQSETAVHINSFSLDLGDTVSAVFGMTWNAGSDAQLLMWTPEKYQELCERAAEEGVPTGRYLNTETCEYSLEADEDGRFIFNGITAKHFNDTYYCRLCLPASDGTVQYDYVFSFSVTDYCVSMLENGTEDAADALCRAIIYYAEAVRDYFG